MQNAYLHNYQAILPTLPENASSGPSAPFYLQQSNDERNSSRVFAKTPGIGSFSVFQAVGNNYKARGRRSGPLGESTKAKAAKVRACFRCSILRRECDEVGPCNRCVKLSTRSQRLGWMDCINISLLDHNIYRYDLSKSQPRPHPPLADFEAILDKFPLGVEATGSLELLAQESATWITHPDPVVTVKRLGMLCSSSFQHTASGYLDDSLIKEVRLLIWTTLLCSANSVGAEGCEQPDEPLLGLKNARNSCGDKVVRKLDKLCRPRKIEQLSDSERKLLFVVIIPIKNQLASASTEINLVRHEFVRALAHVGIYLGHKTKLIDSTVDLRALLDSVKERWNGYDWKLPPSLVSVLRGEMSSEYSGYVTADSDKLHTLVGEDLSKTKSEQRQGTKDTMSLASYSVANFNECQECGVEFVGGLCIKCDEVRNHQESAEDQFPTYEVIKNSLQYRPHMPTGVNFGVSAAGDSGVASTQRINEQRSSRADSAASPHMPGKKAIKDVVSSTEDVNYRVNEPSKSISSHTRQPDLWTCCLCGSGPVVLAISPACSECGHILCLVCDFTVPD